MATTTKTRPLKPVKAERSNNFSFQEYILNTLVQIQNNIKDLRNEIKDLRSETKTEIKDLRSETKTEISDLREETKNRDQRFKRGDQRFKIRNKNRDQRFKNEYHTSGWQNGFSPKVGGYGRYNLVFRFTWYDDIFTQ